MKCQCGDNIKTFEDQVYHYKASGLSNVYLEHIKIDKCEQCSSISPYLPRLNDLQKIIAQAVILQPYLLTGAEIKYLRKERGMKAKEFAVLLRIDPATLSRWENDEQPRSSQNDALVRAIYVLLFNEQEEKRFSEKVTNKIAVVKERKNNPTIWINTSNLSVYQYKTDGEMAVA